MSGFQVQALVEPEGQAAMKDDSIMPLTGPGFDDTVIPSFVRPWPTTDTPQEARLLLGSIDRRIEWLAERGLRAHPNVLARREEVAAIVARFEEEEKPFRREP